MKHPIKRYKNMAKAFIRLMHLTPEEMSLTDSAIYYLDRKKALIEWLENRE